MWQPYDQRGRLRFWDFLVMGVVTASALLAATLITVVWGPAEAAVLWVLGAFFGFVLVMWLLGAFVTRRARAKTR